jgi:hypothetical protein
VEEGGGGFLNANEDRPRRGWGRGGGRGRLRRGDRRVGELACGPDGREVAARELGVVRHGGEHGIGPTRAKGWSAAGTGATPGREG